MSSLVLADALLGKLERAAGVEAVDGDDPWPELTASRLTRRKRCLCGYVVTEPFESLSRCPSCGFGKGSVNLQSQFELPAKDHVLGVLAKAKEQRAQREAAAGGKKEAGKNAAAEGDKGANAGAAKAEPKKVGAQQEPKKGGAQQEPKKGGAQQEAKKGGAQQKGAAAVELTDIQKCSFRVARILECKNHPEADALFVCSLDVGEAKPRSVCAGLRGFIEADKMKGLLVVVITNLKAAKMRGVPSEAMIMAGDHGDSPKIVVPLVPPPSANPGDVVHVDGSALPAGANPPKTLSSTVWKDVVPHLLVSSDGTAQYKGANFMVGETAVTVPGIPSGAGIH